MIHPRVHEAPHLVIPVEEIKEKDATRKDDELCRSVMFKREIYTFVELNFQKYFLNFIINTELPIQWIGTL